MPVFFNICFYSLYNKIYIIPREEKMSYNVSKPILYFFFSILISAIQTIDFGQNPFNSCIPSV